MLVLFLPDFKLVEGPTSHKNTAFLPETASGGLNEGAIYSGKQLRFVRLHLEFVSTAQNVKTD